MICIIIALRDNGILVKVSLEEAIIKLNGSISKYSGSCKFLEVESATNGALIINDKINQIKLLLDTDRHYFKVIPWNISFSFSLIEVTNYPHTIIGIHNKQLDLFRLSINMHEMHLDGKWFTHISKGFKIYEGRLRDEKRRKIRVGDCIRFMCRDCGKDIYAYVMEIKVFRNFNEMLSNIPLDLILPGIENLSEALSVYKGFYGDKDKEYGAIAFKVKVL